MQTQAGLSENRSDWRTICMIAKNFRLKRENAKEFFDYAEWYLFNG